MASASINSDLLIAGILRRARQQPDPSAWLNERHTEALDAVLAGDQFVTSTSFKGQASAIERGIPATDLLQIYEVAIQRFEASEAAGTTASIQGGTDFSQGYSRV